MDERNIREMSAPFAALVMIDAMRTAGVDIEWLAQQSSEVQDAVTSSNIGCVCIGLMLAKCGYELLDKHFEEMLDEVQGLREEFARALEQDKSDNEGSVH